MWRTIVQELESKGCVGPALPIVCQRHRERIEHVSKPGELLQISPDGICFYPIFTIFLDLILFGRRVLATVRDSFEMWSQLFFQGSIFDTVQVSIAHVRF